MFPHILTVLSGDLGGLGLRVVGLKDFYGF